MFTLSILAGVVVARPHTFGGSATRLKAVSGTELEFNLASLEVQHGNDGVMLDLPGWMKTNEPGKPELPVLRASMLVPRGIQGEVRVVLQDAKMETFPLSTWGEKIQHSQGKVSMCGNHTNIPADKSAYLVKYPVSPVVSVTPVTTWRDVQSVVVEVQPVSVDHAQGVVQVLHGGSIKLEMDVVMPAMEPLRVDPAFYSAYSFVFDNWEHQAHEFAAADENGRVLVLYESQFQSQAQTYADLIKARGFSSVLLEEAAQSTSGIQSTIRSHFSEAEKLSYVTIIGRDVPAPTGQETSKECDNCYAMLSGGTSLDLFISRISGSMSEIETYLNKLKSYDSSSTAAWNKKAYGTAFNLAGDEYDTMRTLMDSLKSGGFTSAEWDRDGTASASKSMSEMNSGLGVFSYLGHGSGTAWNTPSISVDDLDELTNTDMPFFEIDVSCLNGGFRGKRCMGEALITSEGGAIATMMHAPFARGTMCKKYQEQAAAVIASGAATRVGPVYFTALTKAQQLDRDDYAMQAYNMFGDPTLWLAFAKGAPPATLLV